MVEIGPPPGGGHSRVETNIYREVRSDAAVRFRVSVYPLKPVTIPDRAVTITGIRRKDRSQRRSVFRFEGRCLWVQVGQEQIQGV